MEKNESFKKIINALVAIDNQVGDYPGLKRSLIWSTFQTIYSKISWRSEGEKTDQQEFIKAFTESMTAEDTSSEPTSVLTELVLKNIFWERGDFSLKLRDSLSTQPTSWKEKFFAKCIALSAKEGAWDLWVQDIVVAGSKEAEELRSEIMHQVLLETASPNLHELILEELLDKSASLKSFFQVSELLRKHAPEKWLDAVISAVTAKDRILNRPLDNVPIETCHEIMQVLTQRALEDQASGFTKRTLAFFCELMTNSPRHELLAAWKKMKITAPANSSMEQLSYWEHTLWPQLFDELKTDERKGPFEIDFLQEQQHS